MWLRSSGGDVKKHIDQEHKQYLNMNVNYTRLQLIEYHDDGETGDMTG